MKKIIAICLIIITLSSFTACGTTGTDVVSTNGVETTISEQESENDVDISADSVRSAPITDVAAFSYEAIDGQMTITNYTGNDTVVVIPDTIEGQSVVVIGDSAFANNENIKGVVIPDSVTRIERNAFCNCFDLEVFVAGDALKFIGEYAFSYCKSLKSVELNVGLETLELSCFTSTDELKELYIPNTVTTLVYPFNEAETKVTIISESGSAAESYAKEMGISFKAK